MADIVQTLIPAGGGDYTLMSTAEATAQDLYGNLVLDNNTYTLECYAGETSEGCLWSGWTTSETNNITVKAADGEGHDGVVGAGYIINYNGTLLNLDVRENMVITGITIYSSNTPLAGKCISTVTSGVSLTVEDCIFRQDGSATSNYAIEDANPAVDGARRIYRNNLMLISGRAARLQATAPSTSIMYNSTIRCKANTLFAITGSTTTQAGVFNTVAVGYQNFAENGTVVPAGSNNASDDSAVTRWPDSQTGVSVLDGVDFVSPSTDDYSPAATGKLDGTGADLSVDFTTDITGATRTVPWTIGAYIVAGGPPPVGIQEMYIKDGGIFVKYTPHVKVGGTFQEVDAYVLEGGTWKPVHEK